ncbi:MAG: septation ring formation regulator EzrA [Bacilli bacterium]|nr:septation ring formation regulator EzrA [Bacilli bacterium]
MDNNNLVLIIVTATILAIILVIIVLNIIQSIKNKKYKKMLEGLEIEKNMLDSSPITPELNKVESFLNNEALSEKYEDWRERLENIKQKQIPYINNMLIEADYSVSKMDYKGAMYKIAKLEMEMYKVKSNSEVLLSEVKKITDSESENREKITNLKTRYRDLYNRFNETINEFGEASKYVTLQFENISKRFETFENAMDKNDYLEASSIVVSIKDMLEHMNVVIEEVPSIVLLSLTILPKRIEDLKKVHKEMLKAKYPLDYLNIDYNVKEAENKIQDVIERLKVLNIEDSLFELKVLMDYFDGVFKDLDKEKANKVTYEEVNKNFKIKLDSVNNLVDNIFEQINDVKDNYDLSQNDIKLLNDVKETLKTLNTDYNVLLTHIGNNTFAYSKLIEEIENLANRLIAIEDRLDNSLNAIGSMKDDESRARQQLEEIKIILKDAKYKMRDYSFPTIPNTYYVESEEASEAIKEIIKELNKKPINIATLNTRVDTARDLVLKLYANTKEMVKNARLAETAIVYGNRYRPLDENLDKSLSSAELLFFKGEYNKSLEISINALNKIDSGAYDKLVATYNNVMSDR